jgi:hypothetical protein
MTCQGRTQHPDDCTGPCPCCVRANHNSACCWCGENYNDHLFVNCKDLEPFGKENPPTPMERSRATDREGMVPFVNLDGGA